MTNLLTVYRFISLCDGIVKYPLTQNYSICVCLFIDRLMCMQLNAV